MRVLRVISPEQDARLGFELVRCSLAAAAVLLYRSYYVSGGWLGSTAVDVLRETFVCVLRTIRVGTTKRRTTNGAIGLTAHGRLA